MAATYRPQNEIELRTRTSDDERSHLPVFDGTRDPGGEGRFGNGAEHESAVLGVDGQRGGLRRLVADQGHGQVGVVAQIRAGLESGRGHGEQSVGGERLEIQTTADGAHRRQGQPDDSVHQRERFAGHLCGKTEENRVKFVTRFRVECIFLYNGTVRHLFRFTRWIMHVKYTTNTTCTGAQYLGWGAEVYKSTPNSTKFLGCFFNFIL